MKDYTSVLGHASDKLPDIQFDSLNKMYFMGIKGVGLTSLALIAKQAGFQVSGCDVEQEFITDTVLRKSGIDFDTGFVPNNFESFISSSSLDEVLLVITGAHNGYDNPIVKYAKERGITVITHGQAVGLFMDGKILKRDPFLGVSVSGSHGKTTISAMCASALHFLGDTPSYTVGTSEVFPVGLPGHLGSGTVFIAEADEYASDIVHDKTPKLYYQKPQYLILNNIDYDHPDLYDDKQDVYDMYRAYVKNFDNTLIVNGDDSLVKNMLEQVIGKCWITFGADVSHTYSIQNFVQKDLHSEFEVTYEGRSFGTFSLQVPGRHNALNVLPVIALCRELKYETEKIIHAVSQFKGTKRRSEIIGKTSGGAILMDDYAHHPKEIETTLESIRSAYSDKKIICIFQPHTYSRTASLLEEFGSSFTNADEVILLPVFASAREQQSSEDVNSRLFDSIKGNHSNVRFFQTAGDVIEYITQHVDTSDYLIITMGAGDVYKICEKLQA